MDSRQPSHLPLLFKEGQGVAGIEIYRAKTKIGSFQLSLEDEPDNYVLGVEAFCEDRFMTKLEGKLNPKASKVEISGSRQAPPQTGPERLVKVVITGMSPKDKFGERTSALTFDLKLNGPMDLTNAVLFKNENRWKKTDNGFKLESE